MHVLPQWATVASQYSFLYGITHPSDFPSACADAGWRGTCLIDRDGLWGATKFLRAALDHHMPAAVGVSLPTMPALTAAGHPLAGSEHAKRYSVWCAPGPAGRSAIEQAPRIVAFGSATAWPALTHMVTQASNTHARPFADHTHLQEFTTKGGWCGFATDSDVALALQHGDQHAQRVAAWWRRYCNNHAVALIAPDSVGSPASIRHAARLARCARQVGMPVVFAPFFRYLTTSERTQTHTLDAIRSRRALPALAGSVPQHLVSVSAAAVWVRQLGDVVDGDQGKRLVADSNAWWESVCVAPVETLGLGRAHPPEDQVATHTSMALGNTKNGAAPVGAVPASAVLRERCYANVPRWYRHVSDRQLGVVHDRLDEELHTISRLGYATFFLTVATVADLARARGIRVQARGSAVGSMVCHVLGLTPLDPLAEELLMQRFCTTLRTELPDIDLDVESARRHEVYEATYAHFGAERVAAVGMVDTYRARSAIRDVGAAYGVDPQKVSALAKAAPWYGSADIWQDFHALPELRDRRLVSDADRGWLGVASSLARLPRHASMHPCGLVLTNATLHGRVATQPTNFSWPMCQLDKHDVEDMGLLKVDVLGVRMQSAIAHAVTEVARISGQQVELDHVDTADERTFELLRGGHTVGVFQVESPGQRSLGGKMCSASMADVTAQISLFRPGPVKADMISPFVAIRHGQQQATQWPDRVWPVVAATGGVVIWHEQVMQIIAVTSGVSLAQADVARRALGSSAGREQVVSWWRPAALSNGFSPDEVDQMWHIVASFGSFGFCRAHAAAFARTTFESAWLKAHHPAAFCAGLLTHSPGLYPSRVLAAEARRLGVVPLGPCVHRSGRHWQVETDGPLEVRHESVPGLAVPSGSSAVTSGAVPRVAGAAIRAPLGCVAGVSAHEVARVEQARPFSSLADVWFRARLSAETFERWGTVGALDAVFDGSRGELLAQVSALVREQPRPLAPAQGTLWGVEEPGDDVGSAAGWVAPAEHTEALFRQAHAEFVGLDIPGHPLAPWRSELSQRGVTWADELLSCPHGSKVVVAGVRSVVHTPPTKSGVRVVFVTIDDPTGLVDVAFFPSAQGAHTSVAMTESLLVIEGTIKHEPPRSVSISGARAWPLQQWMGRPA